MNNEAMVQVIAWRGHKDSAQDLIFKNGMWASILEDVHITGFIRAQVKWEDVHGWER